MDTETPGYTFPVDGVVQAEYAMYPKLAGDEPVLMDIMPSVDAMCTTSGAITDLAQEHRLRG
jgi:hypothetical protein